MRRAVALALAIVLAALPASAQSRLVSLPDQRRIHLNCSGSGSPTVILEAGFGADAGAWYRVQPLIARTTRVCSYDRAGYGQSSMGPLPRDGQAIARDLDAGLRASKIRGPFIIVGHSSGALYARLFTARRLSDMAGLVLVDPSVEHQTARIDRVLGQGAGSVAGIHDNAARCLKAVEAKVKGETLPELAACLPGPDQPAARSAALRPGFWRTQLSEIDTLFTTTSDQVEARRALTRKVPTVILTAASVEGPTQDPGELLHRRLHAELGANFESHRQRLVRSSHMMMFDRPEAIAAEVEELVQANRNGRPKPARRR
jgi:pimeloyl-ACP methyl ester carboxylesterase